MKWASMEILFTSSTNNNNKNKSRAQKPNTLFETIALCAVIILLCLTTRAIWCSIFGLKRGKKHSEEIAFSCDASRSANSFCISLPDYPPLARKCPLPRSWGPSSIRTIFHVKMYTLRIVDSFNRVWVCSQYKNPVENVRNISSRDDWIVIIIWCIKSVSGETSISISNFNSIPIWCINDKHPFSLRNVECRV